MQDKISVIIPVYNAEKHIVKCLNSVRGQTYNNLEIIVINDGSGDGSLDLCHNASKKDQRINVINQQNKGVSYCRNKGVKIATGKYVIFIDSDDYIDKDMVELLHRQAILQSCDLVQCGYSVVYEDERQNKTVSEEEGITEKVEAVEFYLNNLELCVVPWNKLFRKELAQKLEFPEDRRFEDEAVMYKAFYYADKVVNISEKKYNYVQTQDSFMNANYNVIEKTCDLIKAKEDLYKFVSNNCKALEEKITTEFSKILFISNIKLIRVKKEQRTQSEYIWVRKKLKQYFKMLYKEEEIKRTTLIVLRYFPAALAIKNRGE